MSSKTTYHYPDGSVTFDPTLIVTGTGMPSRIEQLERENAALRADKERLDWMEKARPIAWALGSADRGEYWLLTDIGEKHPEEAEEFATLRAAIDAARKEAQP